MVVGLLAWPILLALGAVLRAGSRRLVVVAVAGGLCAAPYLIDYQPKALTAGLEAAPRSWSGMLIWASLCLGSPLAWSRPAWGILLGVALWRLRSGPERLGRFLVLPFAVYLGVACFYIDVPLGLRYVLPLYPLLFVFIAT